MACTIEIEPIPDDSVGKYRAEGLNGPSKPRNDTEGRPGLPPKRRTSRNFSIIVEVK